MKKYTVGNGPHELGAGATKRNSAHMLPVCDWLGDLPENTQLTDLIEVQFKNTRKGYFHNTVHLPLEKGVKVADTTIVETDAGFTPNERLISAAVSDRQTGYITHAESDEMTLWLFFYSNESQYNSIMDRINNR